MAKTKASKKAGPAAPAYSFRTYEANGGYLYALHRGRDGATLLYSNPALPFPTLAAARKAITEAVQAINADTPVLKAVD